MLLDTPQPLAPHHLATLLEGSGITADVIAERGYRTIAGADGYAELKRLGFSRPQCETPGLILPLHTTDGQQPLVVYRPDVPRLDKEGKPLKYEIPKGAGVRLDCPPRCQPFLADPTAPLWLTEGQKKADALASHGAVALALLGVWSFVGKNTFGASTFLPDFDYVAWAGREVRLVFDSDVVSKPSVRKALERLTAHLINKQAHVRQVYLSPLDGRKVGVDDFLAAGHSLQDLEALMEAPRPQPRPAPVRMELLDKMPNTIRRPLSIIDGRTYAAAWLPVRLTRTEGVDKAGHVIRFATPDVTEEQRLFIVRDDGVIFGEDGDRSFDDLGLQVHLPETPRAAKLWTSLAAQAYRDGARPDPAVVFRHVAETVNTFIDFNRSLASQEVMCEMVACYILATWFLDAFNVIGYLWPNGEAGSGKTQFLNVVTELAYLGEVILASGSMATLRDLADYGATLAFDDAENVMDVRRGDPDKRTLLLAGNRKGSSITVKEDIKGEWKTRYVSTFCPRLFSAIRLPDTVLASRTIIVPLIRTSDKEKATADPGDYPLWPVPREEIVDNLWALALSCSGVVSSHDTKVVATTELLGRTLEPWRALLTVAHFLTERGVAGLAGRMHALSKTYQEERQDIEPANLTVWTVHALCHYAENQKRPGDTSDTSDTGDTRGGEGAGEKTWKFASKEIKEVLLVLLENEETGLDLSKISTDRVGRTLSKLRLRQMERVKNKRGDWILKKEELRRLLVSYGMSLPASLFPSSSPSTDPEKRSVTSVTTPDVSLDTPSPLSLFPPPPRPTPPIPSVTSVTSVIVSPACPVCGATTRHIEGTNSSDLQEVRCSKCYHLFDTITPEKEEPWLAS